LSWQGNSGKALLIVSISAFGPTETLERKPTDNTYLTPYVDGFASGRFATRTLPMHCNTVSPFWLRKRHWLRRIPLSGFDFDSRFSKAVDSR
jgi:hypothetical protein